MTQLVLAASICKVHYMCSKYLKTFQIILSLGLRVICQIAMDFSKHEVEDVKFPLICQFIIITIEFNLQQTLLCICRLNLPSCFPIVIDFYMFKID
jgi:hypothetical protein